MIKLTNLQDETFYLNPNYIYIVDDIVIRCGSVISLANKPDLYVKESAEEIITLINLSK